MTRRVALLALLALLAVAACGRPAVPFRVVVEPVAGFSRFRLLAAPGARINARLKPALELEDGTVLRFDAPQLTPDSAYFADAPTVEAPLGDGTHRGIVRASVCPAGEEICRSFVVPLRF
ncbi:MAG: hypothetical protein ACREMV_12990 [Gemmatimonadales bacterium]